MKITTAKTTITVNDTEYEIIKTFCGALTKIYENNTDEDMGEIIERIAYEGRIFDDFIIKIE